jgi:pSer/pThr/pTyr-binding forkhead associated (FHA) protein
MPVLQVNDRSFPIRPGQTRVGMGEGVDLAIGATEGVAPGVHAVIEMAPDGQVVVRRGTSGAPVKVNGIALGMEPTPLIHGDKLEIGSKELLFSDDTKAGATQFVSNLDLARPAQKRGGSQRATRASGGRLVSLVDGKEYSISDEGIAIGRDASSDVVVAQNEVSRRHAEIVPDEQGYVIRDLSTNGVFVNGERVVETLVLSRADVVRIGTEEFRFYADIAPATPKKIISEKVIAAAVSALGASPNADAQQRAAPPSAPAPTIAPAAPPAPPRKSTEPPTAPIPARAAETKPVLASLEVVNEGIDKGKRFEIRVPLAHVGRGAHNDVVIANDSVSDTHAKLTSRDDGWYIADLGSTNGTYVAGVRLTNERRLEGTPDVRFGGVKMVFRSGTTRGEQPKGTRAIASVPVDRAAQRPRPVAAETTDQSAAQRSTSPWIWLLIIAAAVVAALLLLNR